MLRVYRRAFAARAAAAVAAIAVPLTLATLAPAQAAEKDLVLTVLKVHGLDKADELSSGDYFARMTVDSAPAVTSPTESTKAEFKPNWKLKMKVTPGVHKIKFEIIDKDVSVDDPIDINKVDKKRDLEFTIDTKSCKIEGFSQKYSCGARIARAGLEAKKAEVVFSVNVK